MDSVHCRSLAVFSLVNLLNPTFRVAERHALWISLVIGITGGFFGGLTLFIGPAVIMFLVSLHVPKEEFIGTIGLVEEGDLRFDCRQPRPQCADMPPRPAQQQGNTHRQNQIEKTTETS